MIFWKDVPNHSGDVLREQLPLDERYLLLVKRVEEMRRYHDTAGADVTGEPFRRHFLGIVTLLNSIAQHNKSEYSGDAMRVMQCIIDSKFALEVGLLEAAKAAP